MKSTLYQVSEWLALHGLNPELVQDIISAYRASELRTTPAFSMPEISAIEHKASGDQHAAFLAIVQPALLGALNDSASVKAALAKIAFVAPSDNSQTPHVIDHGHGRTPTVSMAWKNDAESLMHLTHEVAHALQINLSQGNKMPPLAREVCAFLGELTLMAYVHRHGLASLLRALLDVWHSHNTRYLGDDLEHLSEAILTDGTAYHYRQNYPIARLVACELFTQGTGPWLEALFASGSDAMAHLPIAHMANAAGRRANYLPALPMSGADQPALGAYRSLGAMALLEIEYWNGVSEAPLGDVYQGLLQHMQKQTAFIALDRHHRPLGYATWEQAPEANRTTLTRQAAPFGDQLELQKALSRHLQHDAGVASRNARSARPEQEAW
ncbi:hypothetical protein [Roseinatronobacter alkalisoli]|uniref:HEXXH motif domain-containing protein n=1 Tax=Roseinatronobacter alkalisoli TaxID=3028235 RepID=A0ABT5TGK2_9RHOB|nr:hypothetical protein [Roseinatronobacter sp. HJB301]MDD7973820.1 hypothetical protein [Roseinatronobacter sp. HJB301]